MTKKLLPLLCCMLLAMTSMAADKPNILFILVDDLGWKDLNCQGNDSFTTPNINRLASEGMRFTDAYSASPVCTKPRAA